MRAVPSLKSGAATGPQAEHDHGVRRFRSRLERLTRDLADGRLDVDGWHSEVDRLIADEHARMYQMGTSLAGPEADRETALRVGRMAADVESQWLDGFRKAIEDKDPRYFGDDGKLRMDGAMASRLDLYALKASGAASTGFVAASPGSTWEWRMTAAEHCPDCPAIAAMSPFAHDELFAVPRDGTTACLTRCLCQLVRGDGVEGYGPVAGELGREPATYVPFSAVIPGGKLREYALNPEHEVGGSKAKFFNRAGFNADNEDLLARKLYDLAGRAEATFSKTKSGIDYYVVDGSITNAAGEGMYAIRIVWTYFGRAWSLASVYPYRRKKR